MILGDPHRADERSGAAAGLGPVDHGKGQVAGIGRQRLGCALAGLLPGPGFRGGRRQLAQQGELALADHPLGVIAIGAEYTAGCAVVGRDRAVGEGIVGLFGVAVALHDQELLLDIGAFMAPHRRGQHWTDVGPDLAPHFGRRTAERPGMLATDDRLVGVVVEVVQLRPPADPDRLARGQHDTNGGLEALGPGVRPGRAHWPPSRRIASSRRVRYFQGKACRVHPHWPAVPVSTPTPPPSTFPRPVPHKCRPTVYNIREDRRFHQPMTSRPLSANPGLRPWV